MDITACLGRILTSEWLVMLCRGESEVRNFSRGHGAWGAPVRCSGEAQLFDRSHARSVAAHQKPDTSPYRT